MWLMRPILLVAPRCRHTSACGNQPETVFGQFDALELPSSEGDRVRWDVSPYGVHQSRDPLY